jgi:hypothetical protein
MDVIGAEFVLSAKEFNPIMMKTKIQQELLTGLRHGLAALALLLWVNVAQAQSTDEDVWGDEDEEETVDEKAVVAEAPAAKRYEDILIRINGAVIKVTEEYHVKRGDTLNIEVRQLQGGSPVTIEVQKGGINLKRTSYYANNLGELDLEVKTGNKKGSGDAILSYTPKGNVKKSFKVKLVIE